MTTVTRDGYDCRLVLPEQRAREVLVVLKHTFTLDGTRLTLAPPQPLHHDLFANPTPAVVPGSDFWPFKAATDVVVRGSAIAPGGRPVEQMTVRVRVGAVEKSIAVFGDRPVVWRNGKPRIEPPAPFTSMPLTWENAYGGLDWRVPPPEVTDLGMAMRLTSDHPGMYPRNPFGKGYLVEYGEVPEMRMPNLEDPSDLLTDDRLVLGIPSEWWRQPLPWCFDFVHPMTFPRCFHFGGADAWFPGPEDGTMPEVARGFLPPRYRTRVPEGQHDLPSTAFFQEASHGLVVRDLRPGDAIRIEGMSAQAPELRFKLPSAPKIEFDLEGKREPVAPRLHTILCEPNEARVSFTWAAHTALPRVFIPGIHKHIPIAVRIDGEPPVHYQPPETVRERIARGIAEGALDDAKDLF